MNNQIYNSSSRNKTANKAIAIQKDLHKTQSGNLNFSQIDMHDLVLTIFKVLLPFLILGLTYLSNL